MKIWKVLKKQNLQPWIDYDLSGSESSTGNFSTDTRGQSGRRAITLEGAVSVEDDHWREEGTRASLPECGETGEPDQRASAGRCHELESVDFKSF